MNIDAQRQICERYGAQFVPCDVGAKLGIARNAKANLQPLNGMRVAPEAGTCGWYIWRGETLSEDPDFFEPLHVEHVADWCPDAVPYLGLPPGWRFLIVPGHTDVWFDPDLK